MNNNNKFGGGGEQMKLLKEYNKSKKELIQDLEAIQKTLIDEFKRTVADLKRDFMKMRIEILRDLAGGRKRIGKNPGVRKNSDSKPK